MEDDDLALSDVHIDLSRSCRVDRLALHEYPAFRTRFTFSRKCDNLSQGQEASELQPSEVHKSDANCSLQIDEDGDVIVERRSRDIKEVIYIDHALSTRLSDVGLQVWLGCLYLCDYIIDNRQTFENALVVEFGAGVGLASIIAAMYARKVYCTDIGSEVLQACSRNVAANRTLRYQLTEHSCTDEKTNVSVKELDWKRNDLCRDGEPFSWSAEDEADLYSADVFIAADVIYSDDLTDAFFHTVQRIMLQEVRQKKLIISVEKRLNFTMEHLDVACPAYNHFRRRLEDVCSATYPGGVTFTATMIGDLPQYFHYERSKYLELWCIRSNVT